MPEDSHSLYWVIGMVLVLLGLVALIYAQTRRFEFISLDDPQYVTQNPVVRGGLTVAGLAWAFTTGTFYWHPLTWMSHMTDVSVFGVNAGPAHLVNATIHALNCILLFLALRKLTGAFWKCAIVAVVFAVHPLHVESVSWISERKDVLSTFFWVATMYSYAVYARDGKRRTMIFTVVLFSLGILAKPMIVTLPVVLLFVDYWPLNRTDTNTGSFSARWIPLVREKIPLFLLSLISVAITLVSQRGTTTIVTVAGFSLVDRAGNAMVSYCRYMLDFVWPYKLAPFYPLQPPSMIESFGTFLVVTSLTVLAWRIGERFRYVKVGWLWYVITLLPVIGFIQAGDQGRADRFMYIPMIGLLILLCWGIEGILPQTRSAKGAIALAAAGAIVWLTSLARTQAGFWKDDLTLWQRTLAVTHDNYRIENLYGVALTDHGRLAEGIAHYLAAIAIWPDNAEAHNNLGTARRDEGRIDDAIAEFTKAAQLKPGSSTFRFNLGVVLSDKGDTAAAIKEIETAASLEPANPDYAQALSILRSTRKQ